MLPIRNIAPVVSITDTSSTVGLTSGFPDILDMIDVSDIIHSFEHAKSSSISQLINRKY